MDLNIWFYPKPDCPVVKVLEIRGAASCLPMYEFPTTGSSTTTSLLNSFLRAFSPDFDLPNDGYLWSAQLKADPELAKVLGWYEL